MTDAELLEIVRTGIRTVVEKGQSVTILNRTYERADLDALRKLEKEISSRVNTTARGGARVRRIVPL
jgi:hypothetical protein